MSSSSFHPPTHLHRVNLHSHGKRPFEECGGYDSDPDTSMPIHTTPSGTSSSSNPSRFPATTTSPTGPETRNKRARSTSSTSTDDSSSNPSSSSGYNTAQSSSRSDIFSDGPSALPAGALNCPGASPPFVATQDVHMSDLHLPVPPSQPQRTHVPTPTTPEDTLRTSLQRFAEFDRQIAALRTSLAATRSPPLPTLDSSVDGVQTLSNERWHHSNPSNFLSNGSSGLPPFTATDPASSTVPVAPNSLSTFASSNGQWC
ncbi:hypothetical protein OG21DRAFT_375714 [Imleria badia]|nr:hypothetical protein OG21DRAFT_375714 [Imleria badia]